VEKEIKTKIRAVRFRPSVKIMLEKLAIIHDRTQASTIEQLIIAEARRYNLIESRSTENEN
jgi:hypothetical protein